MRALLAWLVATLAAACGTTPPSEPEPLVLTAAYEARCERVVLSPEPELRLATMAAAERWSRATGCNVEVGEGGVPVVAETPILRPDGTEAPGATSDDRWLVRVDPRHGKRTDTVTHEVGHVLGAGHAGSGLMSDHEGRGTLIDAESLAAVCAVLDCAAFMPEAP